MAFSTLARAQMRDPSSVLSELQALEDLLSAAAPAAIQDATGVGAILDEGGAVNGTAAYTANGGDDDEMSEPTDAERLTRQLQLDADSAVFLSAIGLGIFNADGEELCNDNTHRPAEPRARPPTPPLPTTGTLSQNRWNLAQT